MTDDEFELFRKYRKSQGLGVPEPQELSPDCISYWEEFEKRQARQGIKSMEELMYGL